MYVIHFLIMMVVMSASSVPDSREDEGALSNADLSTDDLELFRFGFSDLDLGD